MYWDNYGHWVWVIGPVLVIVAAVLRIIGWFRREEGEWTVRVGGHHDPVTGEYHGISHFFNREAELTWCADCAQCIAARDSWSVDDDFGWDPYASVRDAPPMVMNVFFAEAKSDQNKQSLTSEESQ